VRNWTLARRTTVLVLVGTVGLLVGLLVLIGVTGRYDAAVDNLVYRIGPARRGTAELLTTLVEEQNSARGYALTGDGARRAAYQAAVDHEADDVSDLRGYDLDPELSARLDGVLALARTWRTEGAEPLITAVEQNGPRPAMDALYQAEEQRFLPVLHSARALLNDLDGRRRAAMRGLNGYRRTELIVLLVGAALALVAGAATVLLLRRWVTRPIERLAGDARTVADGAYDHHVGVPPGPPELHAVGADVERMRSRIISDLDEVEAGRRALADYRDQLEHQAEELRQSNRDLEQFAYVASHDLQEPLRKVSGFCQLLQRRYAGQLDDRAEQYIEFAVDGAQRMQRLINDLLTFSRAGRGDSEPAEVSLEALTHEVAFALGSGSTTGEEGGRDGGSGAPGAEIVVGALPRVRGDATLLRQLMTNLLGNAVKFRRPGTRGRVEVSAVPDGANWLVTVADDGIGIAPEFADKVFVIFQRLHGREAYEGTGIGLALAKRIVEHHGGRIWLDTERRDGATIHFTLPSRHPGEPASETPTSTVPAPAEPAEPAIRPDRGAPRD
jgi:signal transduction histidine kinase